MPPVIVKARNARTRMALANPLAPSTNEAVGALELAELHCQRDTTPVIVEQGRLCAGPERRTQASSSSYRHAGW